MLDAKRAARRIRGSPQRRVHVLWAVFCIKKYLVMRIQLLGNETKSVH
jgi:hypothetical protein